MDSRFLEKQDEKQMKTNRTTGIISTTCLLKKRHTCWNTVRLDLDNVDICPVDNQNLSTIWNLSRSPPELG
jgi:hypothetical protein